MARSMANGAHHLFNNDNDSIECSLDPIEERKSLERKTISLLCKHPAVSACALSMRKGMLLASAS